MHAPLGYCVALIELCQKIHLGILLDLAGNLDHLYINGAHVLVVQTCYVTLAGQEILIDGE